MRSYFSALLTCINWITALAQHLPAFDPGRVGNQSFNQQISTLDSTGWITSQSNMFTTVRADLTNNRLYHLRQTSDGRRDSTVCELQTLKPIYFSSIGPSLQSTIRYKSGELTAHMKTGQTVRLDKTVQPTQPVYDVFMDTYLVSLLPLRVGFTETFQTFRSDLGRVAAFDVLDTQTDFLPDGKNGLIPTFLVRCRNENVGLLCWYEKGSQLLRKVVIQLPNKTNWIRLTQEPAHEPIRQPGTATYAPVNRQIEPLTDGKYNGIRFSSAPGAGIAWLNDETFHEGTIEFDVRGTDAFQRSFVGIAFHGVDDKTYESVYFRPFNFQATDPARKIHAVQYVSEPNLGFQVLRDTRKDEFEADLIPETVQATDWFHARIEVRNNRIRVFVNDAQTPALDVPSLNPGAKAGRIGFMVGNNSNGDFANLTLKP